jgi:hypothetical protein
MREWYKGWKAIRVAGKPFLALEQKRHGGGFHIWGEHFRNYGAWMTIESFRKAYKEKGEELSLDVQFEQARRAGR